MGDAQYAKVFREKDGVQFSVFNDERRKAYEAMELKSGNIFHLLRRDNGVARGQAKAEGHHQHKLGKNPFQLGGSFVFGPGEVDRFAHVSETFGDNAAVKDLLAAIP